MGAKRNCGIFYPNWQFTATIENDPDLVDKEKPKIKKRMSLFGERGVMLDMSTTKKYGIPSGCSTVYERMEDGVERSTGIAAASDLKDPGAPVSLEYLPSIPRPR